MSLVSRHYLDHASVSPLRPEARDAMLPWLGGGGSGAEHLGAADPGRVHTEGRMARAALEDARDAVATLFGARSREVIFTSGGTEAANTAVWMATTGAPPGSAVVCAAVEHSSVRDACARARRVICPAVDRLGRVTLDAVQAAVETAVAGGGAVALVNLQWANHEVATIQPLAEVVGWCREHGLLTHVDACAAAGHLPIDFGALGADLLSVSAPKMGGPRGMGALIIRRGLRLPPLMVGGEQERARRAGLENVPAAVGFGAVAQVLLAGGGGRLHAEIAAARRQTEELARWAQVIPDVEAYGDQDNRLPHILCLGIGGVEAEGVLLGLDQAGIAAHSGSACSSESLEPSPVLEAMGVAAEHSLRLSVGWSTTDADVEAAGQALPAVIARLRALAG